MIKRKPFGFTLIEVLVVVAIIGVLATAVFIGVVNPAQQRARDTKRMADLRQLQKGLEIYNNNNNSYPLSNQNYEIAGAPWGSPWLPYMPILPQDPLSSQKYFYVSDGFSYQLYANFERKDEINPVFACGACGPDGKYNGGVTSGGAASLLLAFDTQPPAEGGVPVGGEIPVGGGTPAGTIILAQGKQTYTITGKHNSPNFLEATIDPLDVRVGDTQTMSVKISDTYSITSVEAEVETDAGPEIYSLSLIDGTNTNGTWSGSWIVHDTHTATYRTTFTAFNSNNESNSTTLTWTDPCSLTILTDGNYSLANAGSDCNFSGTGGVDNGNLTIDGGYTLTLDAGAVLVFNPGKSVIFTNGSLAKNSTAQMRKTYLWMTDTDKDTYPDSATQIASDTQPDNTLRRYQMAGTYVSNITIDTASTNACINSAINYDCGIDNGSGGCTTAVATGENSLAACKTCNGTSLTSVNITDNTGDSEGLNKCDATSGDCYRCLGGSCTNQTATQDLFGECTASGCTATENCSGTGYSCGVPASDTDLNNYCALVTCTNYIYDWSGTSCLLYSGSSSHNGMCNGSGACYTAVADSCTGAGSQSGSANCGSTGCNYACPANSTATSYDTVAEVCYTDSAQHSCSTNYTCNITGTCSLPTGTASNYAWAEKFGYINMNDAGSLYAVTVVSTGLSGYAWSEKTGWINFDDAGSLYAVTNDGAGNLSGYAWSEKLGYISFDDASANNYYQVTIDGSNNFSGYAWSEKGGYINMNDVGALYGVIVTY